MKIGSTERISAREYRGMSEELRAQRVARQVGELAKKAQLDGCEFVYWPEVQVRWLMPEGPRREAGRLMVECRPGEEGWAHVVQVEVRTTLRQRRPSK